MIKTERGTTTMNGSLEELIKDYLIILSVFKEKLLAGTFTYMEDVEEMQVEAVKDVIKEICEDFRDYHADPLRGGSDD